MTHSFWAAARIPTRSLRAAVRRRSTSPATPPPFSPASTRFPKASTSSRSRRHSAHISSRSAFRPTPVRLPRAATATMSSAALLPAFVAPVPVVSAAGVATAPVALPAGVIEAYVTITDFGPTAKGATSCSSATAAAPNYYTVVLKASGTATFTGDAVCTAAQNTTASGSASDGDAFTVQSDRVRLRRIRGVVSEQPRSNHAVTQGLRGFADNRTSRSRAKASTICRSAAESSTVPAAQCFRRARCGSGTSRTALGAK